MQMLFVASNLTEYDKNGLKKSSPQFAILHTNVSELLTLPAIDQVVNLACGGLGSDTSVIYRRLFSWQFVIFEFVDSFAFHVTYG